MNDTKFGTWTVPESPVDIEYSLVVIDEIRQVVAEGFQRLSRGGIEVGGVLYGTVVGRKLRVMAMRDIACEHARGPTFHLSDNDRALLTGQLERDREDPRLSGMTAVGWFLSHTRSEIVLQPSDLETYGTFFPEPWQVTMVIRPGRAGAMRAGFFVRETDGTVKADQSYHDFLFPDRMAGMVDRPPRDRTGQTASGERDVPVDRPVSEERDTAADLRRLQRASPPSEIGELPPRETPVVRRPEPPDPEYKPYLAGSYPTAKRKLPWGVIAMIAVAAILAVAGLRVFGPQLKPEPMLLALSERDGQLQIHWNPRSKSVVNASRANLEIIDGTDGSKGDSKQTVNLNSQELASGSFTYSRKTGDVQIRMVVTGPNGRLEEGSRFLGTAPPVAQTSEADLTKAQRDSLQDEVVRLRAQSGQQAERIRQLERTLTVLRTRLGIVQTAP